MPIYEYAPLLKEGETGNTCCYFESLQSFSEPHLKVCPQCGHAIHRVMSSFSTASGAGPSAGGGSSQSSSSGDSTASRAARLAMKHSCGPGCRH